ncbi:MAG: phosphoenolpyruvate synthase, partial [Chitinophagaceae bacterium]
DNVKLMIPFCRTVAEAGTAIAALAANGLAREIDPELECYLMAEVPSNVLLAEKFATLFDGFSIGSSDLAQLTLGIDRGASLVCDRFNEQDEAARIMIALMIEKANAAGKPVGFCGQAPSDDPGFAQFLVDKGINSISFHPDALLQGIENILIAEAAAGKKAAAAASAEPASARVHG